MARLAYFAPGVYVEEIASARQPIAGVGTNTVAFIGIVPDKIHCPVSNPDYNPVLTADLLRLGRLTQSQTSEDPAALQRQKTEAAQLKTALEARTAALAGEIKALEEKKPDRDAKVTAAEADLKKAVDAQAALAADATARETNTKANAVLAAQNALAKARTDADDAAAALTQKQADLESVRAQIAAADAGAGGAAAAPAGAAAGGAAAAAADAEAKGDDADAPDDAGTLEDQLDYAGKAPDDKLMRPSVLRPYWLKPTVVPAAEFATKLCTNFTEYTQLFGDFSGYDKAGGDGGDGAVVPLYPGHHALTHAVNGFFVNGGTRAFVVRIKSIENLKTALDRLASIEDVAILAAPGLPKTKDVWEQIESYCEEEVHRNVFAILDAPEIVGDGTTRDFDILKLKDETPGNVLPRRSTHAGFYFPHVEVSDPAKRLQDGDPAWNVPGKYRGRTHVPPSGHVAGIFARTDEERGVHKAPANAIVRGALEVKYYVSKTKQELLNPQGVNCIRLMNGDVTLWGARTIGGDRNGEWKYVNVRRFAGFLEASIDRGTQWVVFEPNDPRLWSKIILNITAFLTEVWRGGALFGLTAQEAFYVKCDAELNPPAVRDLGWVVTEIGVSIVRPAEFVIFRISQSVGAREA